VDPAALEALVARGATGAGPPADEGARLYAFRRQ
jgi:hypothetical protein